MTWKLWFLVIILAGAALAYFLGSRPRKHRSLASMQPGGSHNAPKPELGMEAINMDIVDEANCKNAEAAAMTGVRRGQSANTILNGVVERYGVTAMRKKYKRD